MKILHVIEAYGGGALTMVNQLCNTFCASHDVVLAHSLRAETPKNYVSLLDARVRRVELALTREISLRHDVSGLRALCQLFREEQPDVIHLHSSKAGFLGRMAARLLGMQDRVIYCPHGYAFLQNNISEAKKRGYRLLEKVASAMAGTVVGCSPSEGAHARELTERVGVVPNAIDIPALDALTAKVPANLGGPFTVVTAGRLSPAKQPALFVEVARRVTQQAEMPVEFLWVGGGETPLPEGPAKATGWLPREAALQCIRAHGSLFLTTSAYEGLPLAVLEAQALGLPVVATNVAGNRDALAPGLTGFLGNSAKQLADHILYCLKNPEKVAAMRAAARQFIEDHHSSTKLYAAYLPWYARAAARQS